MLSLIEILALAAALAMDAFAVALGVSASGRAPGRRATFRICFHFGFFQFLMPVLGWYAGARLSSSIEALDHWLAFALLAAVGGRMLYGAFQGAGPVSLKDPSRGLTLLALCLATSMDALAVGLSLGLLGVEIWYTSLMIGVVTAWFSLLGMLIGNYLGLRFGRIMEALGGALLIAVGIKIVADHIGSA